MEKIMSGINSDFSELSRRVKLAQDQQKEYLCDDTISKPSPVKPEPRLTDTHVWEVAEVAMSNQRLLKRDLNDKLRIIEELKIEIAKLKADKELTLRQKHDSDMAFDAMTHTIKTIAARNNKA
jgi:hypothetical protein